MTIIFPYLQSPRASTSALRAYAQHERFFLPCIFNPVRPERSVSEVEGRTSLSLLPAASALRLQRFAPTLSTNGFSYPAFLIPFALSVALAKSKGAPHYRCCLPRPRFDFSASRLRSARTVFPTLHF